MALDPARRRDLHWSHKEKSVARAAFDGALARETAAIRKKAEELLQRSSEPTAVWDVLEFLSKKQRELERKYDYRYSVLTGVLRAYYTKAGSLNPISPDSIRRS